MKKTTIAVQDDASNDIKNEGERRKAVQTARSKNIEALVSFFESGITEDAAQLGIELEHTIVESIGHGSVSYDQKQGVAWILEKLVDDFPEKTHDAEGDLLGLTRPGEAITLEPAAQLELSAGPFNSLVDAERCFEAFEERLGDILAPVGKQALLIGYHPTAKASELELIPKRRYKFMNFYLSEISSYGPCMMRGSASTQVSIDYSSTADCLRKLRLAFALVPILSLVTDNAPVFEGKPRTHELVRTKIWQECDPDRCGLVPGALEPAFDFQSYAEYILDTPAILVPCKNHEWCYSEKTFGEIYAKTPMDRADVEHAVSMFFNDVRLKTYIEIRPADAMPIPYVIAYTALVKGLFYDSGSLDALDELFANVDASAFEEAKENLMSRGYDASVYGKPVAELADTLVALAREALDEADRFYLQPLADLVSRRSTLADLKEESPRS